ncbi:MAG TPA: hypothetical protein VNI57_15045 [Candidatus Saccharimonadales bacterium]|nr:hypothetical protein [Candidatus Saccharimonadales bacterium]
MMAWPSHEAFQAGLIRFLASPEITNGNGSLYSWVNPEHPGFVYPEAMGLHLRLISVLASRTGDPGLKARAAEVAAGLGHETPASGGVGMEGYLYLFDTCMAVGGLHAWHRLLGGELDRDLLGRMAGFIVRLARNRQVLVDADWKEPAPQPHWSRLFGAHMLKTVIALDALHRETGEASYKSLALEIAEQVLDECYDDGIFRMGPGHQTVYCHAHCYALEGLLYLRAAGLRDESAVIAKGAESLAGWQNEDGGMSNWYEDPSRRTVRVGDATAQTVRIWLAVDRKKYHDRIEKGLEFLKGLGSDMHGVRYSSASRDVNTISSTFAAQAFDWRLGEAQPEWLV